MIKFNITLERDETKRMKLEAAAASADGKKRKRGAKSNDATSTAHDESKTSSNGKAKTSASRKKSKKSSSGHEKVMMTDLDFGGTESTSNHKDREEQKEPPLLNQPLPAKTSPMTFRESVIAKIRKKLTVKLSTNNMMLLRTNGKLEKYESAEKIVLDFFNERLPLFAKRKAAIIDAIEKILISLSNRQRFITMMTSDPPELEIRKRPKSDVIGDLEKLKFDKINDSYNYLLTMHIVSMTQEMIETIMHETAERKKQLAAVAGKSPRQMWKEDLEKLSSMIDEHDELALSDSPRKDNVKTSRYGVERMKRKKQAAIDWTPPPVTSKKRVVTRKPKKSETESIGSTVDGDGGEKKGRRRGGKSSNGDDVKKKKTTTSRKKGEETDEKRGKREVDDGGGGDAGKSEKRSGGKSKRNRSSSEDDAIGSDESDEGSRKKHKKKKHKKRKHRSDDDDDQSEGPQLEQSE